MDEPFANLDAGLRRHAGEEIRSIVKRKRITSVFVTHDQNQAFSLCDRVAVIRDGRVVQTGKPAAMYERPSQPWVAQFFGFQLFDARRLDSGVDGMCDFAIGEEGWKVRVRGPCLGASADQAIIAVRPEDVRITLGRPDSLGLQSADVRRVSFGGPTSRVTLGIGATLIEALVLHGSEPVVGDQCGIRIGPDDLLVYPAGDC